MMKAKIGKREYTVTVNKVEAEEAADYAKILEYGLPSTTLKDYARSVISRALALDKEDEKEAAACK